ncbi:hypothetical protein NECAME_01667 [Necator americanus]|uniref:Uncharacterized protein n=1 Tax=Necator americanus TaxID=51031 RepID=W2TQW0_NECAM|nr:hypothetical protein NECAME_01667 [Necator americanus]ETN84440.1 hypothetical protein NECAME_01667 [Necator americanus]
MKVAVLICNHDGPCMSRQCSDPKAQVFRNAHQPIRNVTWGRSDESCFLFKQSFKFLFTL